MSQDRRSPSGCTVWLTGRPGAGKSTIAGLLADRLRGCGADVLVLDGDEVRRTISRDLGFSAADRDENVRRVAALADHHSRAGGAAIVALITPLHEHRAAARRAISARFLEIYVDASLQECIRRDPKGLYARAHAGEIADFTGVSSPYEPPTNADLVLDTVRQTPAQSAQQVLELLTGQSDPARLA
jgi:adenylyl-sulfate kinase